MKNNKISSLCVTILWCCAFGISLRSWTSGICLGILIGIMFGLFDSEDARKEKKKKKTIFKMAQCIGDCFLRGSCVHDHGEKLLDRDRIYRFRSVAYGCWGEKE